MENSFEEYLIKVGIRSDEFGCSEEEILDNVEYFKKCYEIELSAYKALLFLRDYINGDYVFKENENDRGN